MANIIMNIMFHIQPYKSFTNFNVLSHSRPSYLKLLHNYLCSKSAIILGIESSCDETACAIVDSNGTILGETINSQLLTHLHFGGINPNFARWIHTKNITKTCEDTFKAANLKLKDIDAIATTIKPGLNASLTVGVKFSKYLTRIGNKPFIPIHHMEAHALTARMVTQVDFPYLVLLVSGGHCLLGIVESVNKFYLLGSTIDNSPGEVFDKIARRLKLRNIPEFSTLCGGVAIEAAAKKASNIDQFLFPSIMTKYRDCNFSFSSLLTKCTQYIDLEEKKDNVIGNMVISSAYNLCAALQSAAVVHICQRTQRAMEFINEMNLFPKDKHDLVVSGGVGCNEFLCQALNIVCKKSGYRFVRTPSKLCSDNGVMIAWNGVEKWNANVDIIRDQKKIEEVKAQPKASFGESWVKIVTEANLKCDWIKIKKELF